MGALSYQISKQSKKVFYLQMMPFFLFFFYFEANVDQLKYWNWVLPCFELVSGLKVNLKKSNTTLTG